LVLKCGASKRTGTGSFSFNRTFLVLKSDQAAPVLAAVGGFNRTFLVLKLTMDSDGCAGRDWF